jgi:hypothetical protein
MIDDWVPLAVSTASVQILDPLTGKAGVAACRAAAGQTQVYLQLAPGQSLLLRARTDSKTGEPAWTYWNKFGPSMELTGPWRVQFLAGGPELPAPYETQHLDSWTHAGDTNAQRFAGTALYTLIFDRPALDSDGPNLIGGHWELDLGTVCQSARVRLNGRDLGVLFTPPFRVMLSEFRPAGNRLEIEVSNVSANRIRDLDQRGVKWKNFRDINVVNVDYKPFDASHWPLTDSGLLGPVTLSALAPGGPQRGLK